MPRQRYRQAARRVDSALSKHYDEDVLEPLYCDLSNKVSALKVYRDDLIRFLTMPPQRFESLSVFRDQQKEPWMFIPGDEGTQLWSDVPPDMMLRRAVRRNLAPLMQWLWHQGVQPEECYWEYDVPLSEEDAANALFDAELERYAAWLLPLLETTPGLEGDYVMVADRYNCAYAEYHAAVEHLFELADDIGVDADWQDEGLIETFGDFCA